MAKQTVAEKRDGEKLLVSEMIALYCRKTTIRRKAACARSARPCMITPCSALNAAPLWKPKPFAPPAKYTATSPKCVSRSAPLCAGAAPHAVRPPRAGRPAYEGNDEGEEELGASKTRTALDEPDAVRVFVW